MMKPAITETDDLEQQKLAAPDKLKAYVLKLERDIVRLQTELGTLEAENFVLKGAASAATRQRGLILQKFRELEQADIAARAGMTEILGRTIFKEDW